MGDTVMYFISTKYDNAPQAMLVRATSTILSHILSLSGCKYAIIMADILYR